MRKSILTRKSLVALSIMAMAAASAGVATANDTIQPDGDTAVNGLGPLSYGAGGHACSTRGTAVNGAIKVNYNGNGNALHFVPNEALTVTIGPAPTGISVVVPTPISVPGNWNDNSDTFDIPFSTTVQPSVADGSYNIDVNVAGAAYSAGDESGSGKPHITVSIACAPGGGTTNVAPTVDAGGPYGGNEGSAIALSGATATDADQDALTYSWVYSAGNDVDAGASCSFSSATDLQPTLTCTDDGTYTATLTVNDGHGHTPSASATVNLVNANPSVGAVGVTPTSACSVSVSAGFTDAGINDSHTASINWGDSSSSGSPVTETPGSGSGSTTGTHTYTSSGPKTIQVTVTDDELGSGSASGTFTTLNTPSSFLAPINSGAGVQRSVFKLGSTIPVKITVRDCAGAVVSTLTPTVQLQKVDSVPDSNVNEDQIVETATNGKTMRWDGTQYIYNLSTKNSQFNGGAALLQGTYRLWITDGSFFGGIGPVAYFDLR